MLIVAKIVDDLKVAGEGDRAAQILKSFHNRFKLGTVNHGPGKRRFFGINTTQNEDLTIKTDANDKLKAVTEYPISRHRRTEPDEVLNSIEKSAFASVNSSLGWIGTSPSPLYALYSSYLQQKAPIIKVSNLVEQINIVRNLKKMATTVSYPRLTDDHKYDLGVLLFADASRTNENGQLGVLAGLLVGELKNNAIYHAVSWRSHKSKRPVKSVSAAEILAAAEGIDEEKSLLAHILSCWTWISMYGFVWTPRIRSHFFRHNEIQLIAPSVAMLAVYYLSSKLVQ